VSAHRQNAHGRGVLQLLDRGALEVPIPDTYELDRAADPLQVLGTTDIQGKLAFRVS
jgi:hypothetical protein